MNYCEVIRILEKRQTPCPLILEYQWQCGKQHAPDGQGQLARCEYVHKLVQLYRDTHGIPIKGPDADNWIHALSGCRVLVRTQTTVVREDLDPEDLDWYKKLGLQIQYDNYSQPYINNKITMYPDIAVYFPDPNNRSRIKGRLAICAGQYTEDPDYTTK